MSLNSLQDSMSRRAAEMAAMAQRMNNPEQIQALQRNLVEAIQSGAIKPYVGIPLVEELTKKLNIARAQMAQGAASEGVSPAQGQEPIAQQVMQQAVQEEAPQGVDTLPSNLPESYAGGGIIAFEDGGKVERYYGGGDMGGSEIMAAAGTADPYVGPSLIERVVSADEPEWKKQLRLKEALAKQAAAQKATPSKAAAPSDLGPVPGSTDRDILGGSPPVIPAAKVPRAAAGSPGIASLASGPAKGMEVPGPPKLGDYKSIVDLLPEKMKKVSEEAVTKTKQELEEMDRPGNEAREKRFQSREAAQEKDSAIGRALNLMSLGFGIAGSKERTLAGALGNEGRQGIEGLIKGEAAARAAKDKLEDARDNFEQQKVAAKKGNFKAANEAGDRASSNERAATQLAMTGMHYGNTEARELYNTISTNAYRAESLNLERAKLAAERARASQGSGVMGIFNILKSDPANQGKSLTEIMNMATRMSTGYDKSELAAENKIAAEAKDLMKTDVELFKLRTNLSKAMNSGNQPEIQKLSGLIQSREQMHLNSARRLHGISPDTGGAASGWQYLGASK